MRYLLAITIAAYNLFLIIGTVYVIENYHWSPLWFLVTALFIMTIDLVERK